MSRGFHADSPNRGGAFYAPRGGLRLAASVAFTPGDALEVSGGFLAKLNAQTDKCFGIFQDLDVPPGVRAQATKYTSTAACEFGLYLPPEGIFRTYLDGVDAPLVNGVALKAGSNTTTLIFDSPSLGSENAADFDGGVAFVNGEQRNISTGALSTTEYTLTLAQALSVAPAVGDLVYVLSLNAGMKPKFSSSAPAQGISTARADKNNGSGFLITEVHLDPLASNFGPFVEGLFLAY